MNIQQQQQQSTRHDGLMKFEDLYQYNKYMYRYMYVQMLYVQHHASFKAEENVHSRIYFTTQQQSVE